MARSFALDPISAADAARLLAEGGDRYVVDAVPGYPCRRCLRDADIGETVVLVSHDPFRTDSPYRSASPIFLHAEPCSPAGVSEDVPRQLAIRTLSIRAFDREAMMTEAVVAGGADAAEIFERMFDDPAVDHLHVHNADRGCWATAVRRAD